MTFFSSPPFFLPAPSFSPFLSFVIVIFELIAPKNPAFRRLFTKMTANFVRLFSKNRLHIQTQAKSYILLVFITTQADVVA